MQKQLITLFCTLVLLSCSKQKNTPKTTPILKNTNPLEGAWKMVYGEIKEGDSIQIKDMTSSDFIKIIGKDHFAFFNQDQVNNDNFYGGGGIYTLDGDTYTETLQYSAVEAIRNHEFPFTIQIKGDTLIQYGLEEIKKANIKRHIVEKYVKLKK
ncbi:hypothetical protein [Aquimarina longa]|uniref:hypothetical protein n=1 Tax=Aquimarina longa TaxID=1080221 RepID=UPI00078279DA|nr:hypothetical protein [Aquimarina longa]